MIDDAVIAGILERAIPGLLAAWRFGSTAQGGTHGESDVDLAVLARTALSSDTRIGIAAAVSEACGRETDVVDLYRASTVLRMQVVGHGVALPVGDPVARGRFEDFVYSDYARLNEERREILDQVRRDGTIHGR